MNLDEELLKDAEDDQLTIEFIKRYLPQEVKEKFTEEDLYYFLDVLVEYYATSIDTISDYLAKQAKKDKMGEFDPEDLRWIVEGELEYGEGLSD